MEFVKSFFAEMTVGWSALKTTFEVYENNHIDICSGKIPRAEIFHHGIGGIVNFREVSNLRKRSERY